MILTQPYYPAIQIDDSEDDCIQLWQSGAEDVNVNIISRDSLQELVDKLQTILSKTNIG